MFYIKIKEESYFDKAMNFLHIKGFKPDTPYKVLSVIESKLLIVNEENGELAELFPRNCIYMKKEK